MNLFELGAFAGGIIGAVCGGIVGSASLGLWGWLVGVSVEGIIGWFAFPLAIHLLFLIGIFFEEGPKGLMRSFRNR